MIENVNHIFIINFQKYKPDYKERKRLQNNEFQKGLSYTANKSFVFLLVMVLVSGSLMSELQIELYPPDNL